MIGDPREEKGFVRVKFREEFFFLKVKQEEIHWGKKSQRVRTIPGRWITTWVKDMTQATILSSNDAYRWIEGIWPEELTLADECSPHYQAPTEIGFLPIGHEGG
jgi:hypothetical protein